MDEAPAPVEVLCCYSHQDETWLRRLETHLSLLKRQGLISLWHDRLIAPGANWATTIDTHLETASVILLLVSADFLASDYCYGKYGDPFYNLNSLGIGQFVYAMGSFQEEARVWSIVWDNGLAIIS